MAAEIGRDRDRDRDRDRLASMRPRRNGRGNPGGSLSPTPVQGASMRPRRNGRGNRLPPRPGETSRLSFNEAAAQWPRKCALALPSLGDTKCFNEAAAQWPRKSLSARALALPNQGFNEAAAQWPRKLRVPAQLHSRKTASMRPRRNGRGNLLSPPGHDLPPPASMRPRRNGRGNSLPQSTTCSTSPRFNEAAAQWPRK